VHAFVGLRAFPMPSRQGFSSLPVSLSTASRFLPPLFPLHAGCLILSLHFDTGKHQGGKLALVLKNDAVKDRGSDQTQVLMRGDGVWRDGIAP
jgi:hypothetical protein